MTEVLSANEEFERKPLREVERKYLPLFPRQLEHLRRDAMPIEQLYLSHPSEPFSLRLRETFRDNELLYTAALKDRGMQTPEGLDRLEVETTIDADTYRYYKQFEHAMIQKLRFEPVDGVAIDWFDDGHVHIESESPYGLEAISALHRIPEQHFVDITGENIVDNEWRAHMEYRRANDGKEGLKPSGDLEAQVVVEQLISTYRDKGRVIATIAGRSGSGKSTVVREVQAQLRQYGVESVALSTDDYHRGKTWLEAYKGAAWTEWDAPIVYDLASLKNDLSRLLAGQTIVKREFDFASEEPVQTGVIETAPIILVEGIYARDTSLEAIANMRFEIPTPLATCIGRRLLRDLAERPQFAEPEKSLRYILEQAEPAWKAQTNSKM